MVYNEKIKISMLKYQAKLRAQGLYKKSRNTPEAILRNKQKKYINNAILCIKKLFNENHLI